MTNGNDNQQQVNFVFNLHETQQELILALSTLETFFKTISKDKDIAYLIRHELGDNSATIVSHTYQVMKYLEIVIEHNQMLLNAMSNK